MALKQPFAIKTVSGATDLTLTADARESFLVTDIRIYNPASNYITVSVGRRSVLHMRCGGALGSHVSFLPGRAKHAHDWTTSSTTPADQTTFAGLEDAAGTEIAAKMIGGLSADTTYPQVGGLSASGNALNDSLLSLLYKKGLWRGIPVASGETLTITGASQSGAVQMVIYQVFDAEDQTPDKPNGSESPELDYIIYGSSGGNINKTGDTELTSATNPAEFPGFPFSDDVPAQSTITVFGVCASDVAPAACNGTNYCITNYLKLFRDNVVLFDEDKNGILCQAVTPTGSLVVDRIGEGLSIVGNFTDLDYRPPLFFPEPLVFEQGQELTVYWTTTKGGSGANISAALQEVGFICRLVRSA